MTGPTLPLPPVPGDPLPSDAARALGRVRAVQRAADKRLRKGDVTAVKTRRGGVVNFERVMFHEDGAHSRVEVHIAGTTESGEATFVIVNPPTLARDPQGEIEINGERYRDDPLGAIADVIDDFGGAQSERGRKGRAR